MTRHSIENTKAPCPKCECFRNSVVRGRHSETIDYTEIPGQVYECTTGYILQCCGCSAIFYKEQVYFSEETEEARDPLTGEWTTVQVTHDRYWPTTEARARPAWFAKLPGIDPRLKDLMTELYSALDNGLTVLAGIGIRTCFDRATELVKVDTNLNFAGKLEALLADGRIGSTEKDILAGLIDAGNAAAHRGWSPSSEDLRTMMDVLEQFIHRNFFLRDESAQLRERVPRRGRN